jgi:putative ABC transport system permease protein
LPDLRRTLRLVGPLVDEAFVQLRATWRQQVLTMLGTFWGAAAVILLLSIGAGFYQFVDLGFKKTGDRYLFVAGQYTSTEMGGARPGRRITFEREDLERLRASAPSARLVGAEYQATGVTARTPLRTRGAIVSAVTPELGTIKVHRIEHGRWFDHQDDRDRRRVAVLGATLVSVFFGSADPLGRTIQLDGSPFKVIGTLRAKGNQLMTNNGPHDEMIFVPLGAGQRLFDLGDAVGALFAEPHRVDETDAVRSEIRAILWSRHRLAPEEDQAVDIGAVREIEAPMKRLGIGLEILLGSVGTLILAMAGAGVANLMIAIVQQRRVELAMRRAFGARRSDLVLQLLVETVVVVLAGGVLGAGLAAGALALLGTVPTPAFMPLPRLSTSVIATTIAVLFVVGVGSGIAPGRAASRVDPATAMRVT